MNENLSRRKLLKWASAGLGSTLLLPRPARAAKKTLRILQWSHFVPRYDAWFNGQYAKKWGEENDTEVIVDNLGISGLAARATAEAAAKKGHDLFLFLWPPPMFEDDVIDHREIYEECEKRFGRSLPLALRSSYNPVTKKHYGFCNCYVPDPLNYRVDLWAGVGMKPNTWDDVRVGGRKIKAETRIPVGLGVANELDSAMGLRAVLYSFGGSEQDENGALALGSKQTLEALKFVQALYKEAMGPEVLSWDPASNNRAMIAGRISAASNAISITREAEGQKLAIAERIGLAASPAGPAGRLAVNHGAGVYVIWKFAENIEGAKKFLVDLVGASRESFVASEFYNFPSFPKAVPDLAKLLAHDERAKPEGKYAVLAKADEWSSNVGHPGYANAAVAEVFGTWVLNNMFGQVCGGGVSPKAAMEEAVEKCRRVWAKWKERKLL